MRPQVPTPPPEPECEARSTMESRTSTGKKGRKRRKRSNQTLISKTPSTSSAVNKAQPEPELSISVPEPVKPEPVVQTIEKPARSEKVIVRKSVPLVEELQHINHSKKLQCLQSDVSSSEDTPSEESWYPEELRQQMMTLLLEDMASDKEIFNCVKEKLKSTQMSSPPYLRELMTAVCKAAEKDLLRIFYQCSKDKKVSSEEASCKCGTSKDPDDPLGRGVALKTITAFFTWLREAESQDN